MNDLYAQGKSILEQENATYYEEFNKSSSQKKFLSQILTGGTLSDKISALTLLVQEAPLHNIKALDNLYGMCEKKSRTAALQCINALSDLFVNGILPPDRKLKYFNKQPLSSNLTPQQLAILYFEDYLKKLYFKFIGILEKLSHDSIVHVRTKVVGHVFELLKAKPEQEANLLRLGVNKLGDNDNKVSSKASYQVLQLEQQHPAMKQIVVEQVIDFLFRRNNEHDAIYYSVLALNQTILTRREEKLANKLVDAYFKLFEKQLIETDATNVSKLKESEHQKDGKRKRNFKKGKKGGKSVKNEKTEQEVAEERNSKLFAAILTGLNRAYPFSDLPYEVFNSHLDTLYKITHSTNFNTSVQALLLIHNITISEKNTKEETKDRYYRTLYESLLDSRLLVSSKQGIYLNLLFKSLKQDSDKNRVMAFVKRIVQICLGWLNVGTISGMLYLLIELEKSVPELRNLFYNTPMDDILNAKDAANSDDENEEGDDETKKAAADAAAAAVSATGKREIYDPRKRDPKFANANKASMWEINHFINHYHPTVSLYAEALLEGPTSGITVSKPDLGLFSLSHFLDRFVYKNFKKTATTKGSSIMQPLGGLQTGALLVRATGVKDGQELPANTTDWISKKIEDIKPEDKFFYQYFSSKQDKIARSEFDKGMEKKAVDDDEEENASDLDDDTVWNALVKSNPEVEGDEDDFDDELSDLEMEDFSDDDDDEEEEANIDVAALGEDDEDDDDEDGEGLVRLTTVEDLEGDDDDEEEEESGDNKREKGHSDDESSDDEDIQDLLGDDDAEYDSDDLPSDLDAGSDNGSSDDEDDEDDEDQPKAKKSKKRSKDQDAKKSKSKRQKLGSLPTFASAEDYAQYLESDDDDEF
ncbi:unnamed protein product [Ambrosiozyma monospora]|uniref:Unnamed protein product n=1 Tax=Ambrosiozyma monospora TaxID=43982 RepID=A0A9W6Z0T9_AMBMO|nr:unnamed protein product [Ambrosiozyma monospora]